MPAAAIASTPSLRRFIDQLLEGIATAVDAERATLTRIENESSVVIEGSFDVSGPAAEPGQLWPISAPEVRRLIAERRPMIRTWDPAQLPSPFREQLAGVRSMITLPLVYEGSVFGTIAVSRRQDRPFESSDVGTLQALGGVAVLALRNAGMLAQAEAVSAELQTSDERFQLLVEGVKDYAIFMLDPLGYVTSWNAGAERIKGYTADEIIGRHFSTFYQAGDVTAGKPAKALAAAEREGSYRAEGWRVRKDGTLFLANVLITALYDDANRLRGFAKVTRDITEQRQIQDKLLDTERREAARFHELADELAALEQTKSRFLNLASHELRTPVALIRGYLSLFEEGSLGLLNESGKGALSVLRRQVQDLNYLIGQMLEAARLHSGTLALRQDDLDLRVAAAQAVERVRGEVGTHHELTVRLPADPVPVTGDGDRLSTILQALLDNAVKYSPNGGEVGCEVLAESGWARVKVTDQGIGLDPDQLGELFSQFGRVVTNETAAIGGAGLGLYLARELARLQGGDISAESDLGRGSTFMLSLPLGKRGSVPAASPDGNSAEPRKQSRRGPVERIEKQVEVQPK